MKLDCLFPWNEREIIFISRRQMTSSTFVQHCVMHEHISTSIWHWVSCTEPGTVQSPWGTRCQSVCMAKRWTTAHGSYGTNLVQVPTVAGVLASVNQTLNCGTLSSSHWRNSDELSEAAPYCTTVNIAWDCITIKVCMCVCLCVCLSVYVCSGRVTRCIKQPTDTWPVDTQRSEGISLTSRLALAPCGRKSNQQWTRTEMTASLSKCDVTLTSDN